VSLGTGLVVVYNWRKIPFSVKNYNSPGGNIKLKKLKWVYYAAVKIILHL
jgi:hypothetical protein